VPKSSIRASVPNAAVGRHRAHLLAVEDQADTEALAAAPAIAHQIQDSAARTPAARAHAPGTSTVLSGNNASVEAASGIAQPAAQCGKVARNRRGRPSKPPLDMNTTWSPARTRCCSAAISESASRRTDAFATQSGDHLARVPCQFGSLQEHDDVGIAKRRGERVRMGAPAASNCCAAPSPRRRCAADLRAQSASVVAIAVGWWAKSS
jgi:hypothetical protein